MKKIFINESAAIHNQLILLRGRASYRDLIIILDEVTRQLRDKILNR